MWLFLLVLTAINSGNEALYIKNLSSAEEGSIFPGDENEKADSIVFPLKTDEMNTEELRDFKENVLISNPIYDDLNLTKVSEEYDHENDLTTTSKIDSVYLSITTEEPSKEHSNYEKILPDPKIVIIPVDYQKEFSISKLEDDIRTEVKEETLLEENFNSPIVKALEDIPDTEIRKELTTDILAANHIDDIKDENGKNLKQDDSVKEPEITTNEETNESKDTHIETSRSDLILNESVVKGKIENIEEDKADLNKDKNISRAQNERSLLSFFGNIVSTLNSPNDNAVVVDYINAEKTTHVPLTEFSVTVKVDGAEYFHNEKEQIITEKYMEDDDQHIESATGTPLINSIDIVKTIVDYFNSPTQEELYTTNIPEENSAYHEKEAVDFKDNSLETTTYNPEPTTKHTSYSDLDEKTKRSLGYIFSMFTASKITTTEIPHITATENIFEKDYETTTKVVNPHHSYEPYKYYETTPAPELLTENHEIFQNSEYKTSPTTFVYELNKDLEITTENYKEFNDHKPESIKENYDNLENNEYMKYRDITTESQETKYNTQKIYVYGTSAEPEVITEYTEVPDVKPHVNGIFEKDTESITIKIKPNLHYEHESHTMPETELVTKEQHSTHSNEYKTTLPTILDTFYKPHENIHIKIETETNHPSTYESYTHHDVNPEQEFITEPHHTEISATYSTIKNHEVHNKDQHEMTGIYDTQKEYFITPQLETHTDKYETYHKNSYKIPETRTEINIIPKHKYKPSKEYETTSNFEYDDKTDSWPESNGLGVYQKEVTDQYIYTTSKPNEYYEHNFETTSKPFYTTLKNNHHKHESQHLYDTTTDQSNVTVFKTEHIPLKTSTSDSLQHTASYSDEKESETTLSSLYFDEYDKSQHNEIDTKKDITNHFYTTESETNPPHKEYEKVTDKFIYTTSKIDKYDEYETTSKPTYTTLKNNEYKFQHHQDTTTDHSYVTSFKAEHIPPKSSISDNFHVSNEYYQGPDYVPYGGEQESETTLSSLNFDDHDKSYEQHNKIDRIQKTIDNFYSTESVTNPTTNTVAYVNEHYHTTDDGHEDKTNKPTYLKTDQESNKYFEEPDLNEMESDDFYGESRKFDLNEDETSRSYGTSYLYVAPSEITTTITTPSHESYGTVAEQFHEEKPFSHQVIDPAIPASTYNHEKHDTYDVPDTTTYKYSVYEEYNKQTHAPHNEKIITETETPTTTTYKHASDHSYELSHHNGPHYEITTLNYEHESLKENEVHFEESLIKDYKTEIPEHVILAHVDAAQNLHDKVKSIFNLFSLTEKSTPIATTTLYNNHDIYEAVTDNYDSKNKDPINKHEHSNEFDTSPYSYHTNYDSDKSTTTEYYSHTQEITPKTTTQVFNNHHELITEDVHLTDKLFTSGSDTTYEMEPTEAIHHVALNHKGSHPDSLNLDDKVHNTNSYTTVPTGAYINHKTTASAHDNHEIKDITHTSHNHEKSMSEDNIITSQAHHDHKLHKNGNHDEKTTHIPKNDKTVHDTTTVRIEYDAHEKSEKHYEEASQLDDENTSHKNQNYDRKTTHVHDAHEKPQKHHEKTSQVHHDHKSDKNQDHNEKIIYFPKNRKAIHATTTVRTEYDAHEKSEKYHEAITYVPENDKIIQDATIIKIKYDANEKSQEQHEAASQVYYDHKSHKEDQSHDEKTTHVSKTHKTIHDTTKVGNKYDVHERSQEHQEATSQANYVHTTHKYLDNNDQPTQDPPNHKTIHDTAAIEIKYDAHEKSEKHHEAISQVDHGHKLHKNQNHEEKIVQVPENDKILHDATTVRIKYDAHEETQKPHETTSHVHHEHKLHKNQNRDETTTFVPQIHKKIHDATTVRIEYDAPEIYQKHHETTSQVHYDHNSHKKESHVEKPMYFQQTDNTLYDTTTVRIKYDVNEKPLEHNEAISQVHQDHKLHKNQNHDKKTTHVGLEKSEKHHEATSHVDPGHKSHKNQNHEEKLTQNIENSDNDKGFHTIPSLDHEESKYGSQHNSELDDHKASVDQEKHIENTPYVHSYTSKQSLIYERDHNNQYLDIPTHVPQNHKKVHDTSGVGIEYDANEKSEKYHEAISHVPENDKIIQDATTIRIKYNAHEKSQEQHEATSQVYYDHKSHNDQSHDAKTTNVSKNGKTKHDTTTVGNKYDVNEKSQEHHEATSQINYVHTTHKYLDHNDKPAHAPQNHKTIHDTAAIGIKYDANEKSEKHHEAILQVDHGQKSHKNQNHEEKIVQIPEKDKIIHDATTVRMEYDAHEIYQKHHETTSQVHYDHNSHKKENHDEKPMHVQQIDNTIYDTTTVQIKYDVNEKPLEHHEVISQVHEDHKLHQNQNHDKKITHVPENDKTIHDTTTGRIKYDAHEKSEKHNEAISQIDPYHKSHKNQNHEEKLTQKIENSDNDKGFHTIPSLDREESKYGSQYNSELNDHKVTLDHVKHIETTPYVHSYTSKPSLIYDTDHHNQYLDNHKEQFEDSLVTHTIGYDTSKKSHETTPSVSHHYTIVPTTIYDDTHSFKITTSPPMYHNKFEKNHKYTNLHSQSTKSKTIDDSGNAYNYENPQDTKPSYLYTTESGNSYDEHNLYEKHKIPSTASALHNNKFDITYDISTKSSNIPYNTNDRKTTIPNYNHHETTEYSTDKSHHTEYLPISISNYGKNEKNYEKSEISKITTFTPTFHHDHDDSKVHKIEVTTDHDYTTRSPPDSQTEKPSTPKNILALLNKNAKSAIAEFRKNVSPKKKIFRNNKIIIDSKKEDELISAVGKIIEPTIKEFGVHDTEEITKAISIQLIRHATRDMGIEFTEKPNYPTIEFIYVDPSKSGKKYQTIELKEILKGKKDENDDDDDHDDFDEDDDESLEKETDKKHDHTKKKYPKKVFKVFFHRNQEERDAFVHSLEEKHSNSYGRSFENGPELYPIPLPDISLGDNEKLYGVIIENNLHTVTKKSGVDSVGDLFTTTEHILDETTEHLYQSTEYFTEKYGITETSLGDVQSRTIDFEEESGSGGYLIDAIVEAAELTTELSRQVNSFRETFAENRSLLTSSSKITAVKSPREVVESSMGGDDQGVLSILLLSLGILFTVLGAISFYIIKVRKQQGTLEFEPVDQTEMEEKSRISSSC